MIALYKCSCMSRLTWAAAMKRLFSLLLVCVGLCASLPTDESDGYEYGNVIRLHSTGLYVAKFYVTWTEVRNGTDGRPVRRDMSWERNGDHVTSPFSADVAIRDGSTNVKVLGQEYTGLVWDKVRTVVSKPDVPLIKFREFHIYGTTLSPHYEITPPLD